MSNTRYVIMANGQGSRWGGHLGKPKHLIEVEGETLLRRIVRQVRNLRPGSEVIVSSSSPEYETEGATRHSPVTNELEIDRFVPELFSPDICFLYGDTYYSDEAMRIIVEEEFSGLQFFGDESSIVAVKSRNLQQLEWHFYRVRELYLAGEISSCIGWQLYQSYAGLRFGSPMVQNHFTLMPHFIRGINTPGEYEKFIISF